MQKRRVRFGCSSSVRFFATWPCWLVSWTLAKKFLLSCLVNKNWLDDIWTWTCSNQASFEPRFLPLCVSPPVLEGAAQSTAPIDSLPVGSKITTAHQELAKERIPNLSLGLSLIFLEKCCSKFPDKFFHDFLSQMIWRTSFWITLIISESFWVALNHFSSSCFSLHRLGSCSSCGHGPIFSLVFPQTFSEGR